MGEPQSDRRDDVALYLVGAAAEGQDFVMCCVANDNDLRAVTTGADGAFAGMKKGATFVDHTTASAEVARELDAAATKDQKAKLGKLSPSQVTAKTLAGEPITAILTEAPGNHAAIGGLKVTTENGWFAARPSGTEDVYKIYTESFKGKDHLKQIQTEAQALVNDAIGN